MTISTFCPSFVAICPKRFRFLPLLAMAVFVECIVNVLLMFYPKKGSEQFHLGSIKFAYDWYLCPG